MNQEIKEQVIETYGKKYNSEFNIETTGISLIYQPNISKYINVSIAYLKDNENREISAVLERKDTIFLKNLLLPKLKKDIKKIYGEVDYLSFIVTVDMVDKNIRLFSEFRNNINELKNHLIKI